MTLTQATGGQFENAHLDAQEGNAAGGLLLALCTKVAPLNRNLSAFEDETLGEYCVAGECADHMALTQSVVQALRILLGAERYSIVLVLLRKVKSMTSTRILKDAADILPFSAASCFEKETKWKRKHGRSAPDELIEIIQLLAENGADVRAFDNHGNTALFYACMLGHHELFRKLLELGAAMSTTHTFVSWRQMTASNLLQSTLEAFAWQEVENPYSEDFPWQGPGDGWRRIASELLDVGQRSSRDDPHMLKLLHTACFQGDTPCIERLIEYGVPIDAPTVREHRSGRFYACALHAAAAGGQAHVIHLLLDRGAQPQDERLSTRARVDWEAVYPGSYNPPRRTRKQTALAVATDAMHHLALDLNLDKLGPGAWNPRPETSPLVLNLWETCRILLEAESRPKDHIQLLELSARCGQVSLVRRLLQMGCRLAQVCDTRSFETIQLLIQHGPKFEARQLQKFAIEKRDCGLLDHLFQAWGNLVPSEDLRQHATAVIRDDDNDMLDVLISFESVNKVFPVKSHKDVRGETFLQIACREGSKKTIDRLIDRGANLYLPGTNNNALTTLADRLQTQTVRRTKLWDVWSLVQLLERHMPIEGKKMRDDYKTQAQHLAQVHKGTNHNYLESLPGPALSETQPRVPMERIDGEDFEHTPLSGRGAFRTMMLHPETDPGAPIECELVPSDLFLTPEYEAISYVWGDKTVPRYIRLDGKVLQITPNLYEALLTLRRRSTSRRLWVDAICINQHEVVERNQQVTIMGEIYMNASRVVIWLGDAGEDSHLIFQHLARFRQHQDDVRSGRSKPTDAFGESHLNPPSYEEATSVALERLFQRPWFFRTWVIQEKALSKEALICCGSESASWEELFRPMGFNSGLSDRPIHGIDYGDRAHQIDVLSPSNRSDASRAVLKYSRDCQVTDPKDRVYGILGLLKPGLVKVEYESSVQEIYRSFTQAIIEDSGSIQLLNLCGPRRTLPGLPSWVPDFNARRSSCHLPDLNERSVGIHMHWFDIYLTRALPGLRFHNNGKELVVKGKAIDTVRVVGDEMPVSKEYALGTEGFSRILSGWESLAVDNLPNQSSSTGWTSADPRVTISHAFLSTLVALNTYCGDETSNPYMPFGGVLWYKQHGTGELMMREPQYFEDIEYCTMLSFGDMDDAWWYDSDYDWYVKELEKAIYGRRLFVTEGGYLGLGEPLVQPGDEIVFLCGNVYPFAARKSTRDTFTLLGDCYIYKLDVLKLFEDHKKPVVEFNIE